MVPLRTRSSRYCDPVIAAGRIQNRQPRAILRDGKADLVGLARVLFADPCGRVRHAARSRSQSTLSAIRTLCTRRSMSRSQRTALLAGEAAQQFIERVGG